MSDALQMKIFPVPKSPIIVVSYKEMNVEERFLSRWVIQLFKIIYSLNEHLNRITDIHVLSYCELNVRH